MSEAARVTSVEAVQRFYAAVRVFQDEAETALLTLDQQLAKVLSWYDYDCPHYWKEAVRRSFDEISRARVAYETCRMRTVADHRPSCYEEKLALEAAKRRQEYCHDQVEVVSRWVGRLHRVIDEFRAHSGRFQQYLQIDVENTANLLARTVTSLESYLEQSLPSEASPRLDGGDKREEAFTRDRPPHPNPLPAEERGHDNGTQTEDLKKD